MKKKSFNDKFGLTTAVLSGRKTMFRSDESLVGIDDAINNLGFNRIEPRPNGTVWFWNDNTKELLQCIPKYKIGEVVAILQSYEEAIKSYSTDSSFYHLIKKECDFNHSKGRHNKILVKSILMPHKIKITNIRLERLQDISDEDCLREGIQYIDSIDRYYFENPIKEEGFCFKSSRVAFAALTNMQSGTFTWESNPYVFSYEFELIK